MKIEEYLDEHGTKMSILAKRAGLSHRTIHSIIMGNDIRLSVALRIEDATKGQVRCRDMEPDSYLEFKNIDLNEQIKTKSSNKNDKRKSPQQNKKAELRQ